jgi:RecA-family ATPase
MNRDDGHQDRSVDGVVIQTFQPRQRKPRPPQYADGSLVVLSEAVAQDHADAKVVRAAKPKQEREPWERATPIGEPVQDEERIPPRVIRPIIFFGKTPPKRRWIAPDWIPYGAVTGLYGQGGLGKSLLAMLLQTSAALGSPWLGLAVEEVISLGVYCEDDEEELWRRQWAINADHGCDLDQRLEAIHWMPRLGEDNLLMTFNRNGVGELTTFHGEVIDAALDFKAKLVIIDANTDTFGGNENDRGQVRQFVQIALYRIAHRIKGAVLCNAHPSRAGVSSGSGESGSTAWEAAFRSRLYFYEPKTEDGPRDYDARILERMKANYAARGDQLKLRYRKGVFIPDGVTAPSIRTAVGLAEVKAVFLRLVSELDRQKRPVSSNSKAGNYAPRLFAKLPAEQRNGFQQADLERAMNILFNDREIDNVNYGRKGDERTKIVVQTAIEGDTDMLRKCNICGADPAGRWMTPAAILWRDPHQTGDGFYCYPHLSEARKAELSLAPSVIAAEAVARVPVNKVEG